MHEVHLLVAERQFPHEAMQTAEYEVLYRAEARFGKTFVRVFDATLMKVLHHTLGDARPFVNELRLATDNLEVQVLACVGS